MPLGRKRTLRRCISYMSGFSLLLCEIVHIDLRRSISHLALFGTNFRNLRNGLQGFIKQAKEWTSRTPPGADSCQPGKWRSRYQFFQLSSYFFVKSTLWGAQSQGFHIDMSTFHDFEMVNKEGLANYNPSKSKFRHVGKCQKQLNFLSARSAT